ncbi:MAG: vanadium-dependent haloperoxidase [Pseudomonadota bacterium]
MANDREQLTYHFRTEAAEKARHREHPEHVANADETRYASACYPMSFTKGLEHDEKTGLVKYAAHFKEYRSAIDNGYIAPFTTRVPVPRSEDFNRRLWEAPTAGMVHDLQGPDPQAVTMPPAPALCSDELNYEMAEVYELALLRDLPFFNWDAGGGTGSALLDDSVDRLNALPYPIDGSEGRARTNEGGVITKQTAFRGSAPGAAAGPYVSQLMLIGTVGDPSDGIVGYGAQKIDQRVPAAAEGDDYMMIWDDWLAVQNGFEVRGSSDPCVSTGLGQDISSGHHRFIYTPRDMATYVHIDALYQAYLTGCLILLANGTPYDPGFELLSGRDSDGIMIDPMNNTHVPLNAGGFALFGGPHILSLVTEVATRALKAVRYQKFNVHLRLRPEALAGRMEAAEHIDKEHPSTCGAFTKMRDALAPTIEAVRTHNNDAVSALTALLPMAFQEGSPMHPTYGAGHATVAGACVTILKAYFDTSALFARAKKGDDVRAGFYGKDQIATLESCGYHISYGAYHAVSTGKELKFAELDCPLTLEGELNKLAANISIGRNMAGVHYYSDYYDSARMGEEIAIGILEEQALGYIKDDFVMSLNTFDGDAVRIGRA